MIQMSRVIEKIGDVRINELGMIEAGPALLYLYRRFGPSAFGNDAENEVCSYYLPTEVDGLRLAIHIGARTARLHSTGTQEVLFCFEKSETWCGGNGVFQSECEAAIEHAIRDLLKPVRVRDLYITVLGEAIDEGLQEWNESEERFEHAGWGYG